MIPLDLNAYALLLAPMWLWKSVEIAMGLLVFAGCILQRRYDPKFAYKPGFAWWRATGQAGIALQAVAGLCAALDGLGWFGNPRPLANLLMISTLLIQTGVLGPVLAARVRAWRGG